MHLQRTRTLRTVSSQEKWEHFGVYTYSAEKQLLSRSTFATGDGGSKSDTHAVRALSSTIWPFELFVNLTVCLGTQVQDLSPF